MSIDDEKISKLYHEGNNQTPPSQLDDVILRAACNAVHKPATDKKTSAKSPFSGSWTATISIAAVLIITVILVPLIEQDAPTISTDSFDEKRMRLREIETERKYKQEQNAIDQIRVEAARKESSLKAKKRFLIKSQEMQDYQSAPAMPSIVGSSNSHSKVATQKYKADSASAEKLQLMRDYLYEHDEESSAEQSFATTEAEPSSSADAVPAKIWLEKIQQLIKEGEIELARKELEAFKKQYPDEKIDSSIVEAINQ